MKYSTGEMSLERVGKCQMDFRTYPKPRKPFASRFISFDVRFSYVARYTYIRVVKVLILRNYVERNETSNKRR